MSTNFSFGAKTSAPAFPTGSITYGTPSAQPQSQPMTGGFQFGATPITSSWGSTIFEPATTAKPTLSFGAPTSTSSAGINFGASTTSGFGSLAVPSSSISFGLGATTTTQTSSLGLNFAASSAAPTIGFSTPSTSGAVSFGLSTAATTTTSTSLGFGIGAGIPTTSTFSLTQASTTPPSIGLGGIATTQAKSALVAAQKELPPKEQPLPNEILQTVENFKEVVKQQKQHSSEIARCSVRDFRNIEQEIDLLNNYIHEVESQLQKNRQLTEKLKYDTAKSVQDVEMAQRTHDIPPGLQYENNAPVNFFLNLADQFEQTMQMLKIQIESADKYVKDNKKPDLLTPQDLALGMRRLHETFVALAGRLQSVHSQVESQKEAFLNIRKALTNDTSNPFDSLGSPQSIASNLKSPSQSAPKVATGPTPFSNFAMGNINLGIQQPSTAQPSYSSVTIGNTSSFGGTGAFTSTFTGNQPSKTSLFGTTFGQVFGSSSFQLQKPPTGNKRGISNWNASCR
ncbi:nuclear pore complex protein Nup58 isoform X2 [Cylas formicarius]|uniref:nuclear pore complex protein Nup58 isoform X2 n=1 Tax=Cylas formicarius TaxID=197179 RepID=UPI002958B71F|nr:nuclear pore complex protein Nup58 isoform X2 [Cylas formicarius]